MRLLCMLGTLHSILGFGKLHGQHFFPLHAPIIEYFLKLHQTDLPGLVEKVISYNTPIFYIFKIKNNKVYIQLLIIIKN